MLHALKIYLICLPFTLLLDYIWLAKLMQGFYIKELGPAPGSEAPPLSRSTGLVPLSTCFCR